MNKNYPRRKVFCALVAVASESQLIKKFLSDALSVFVIGYFFVVQFHVIVSKLLVSLSKMFIMFFRVACFLLSYF